MAELVEGARLEIECTWKRTVGSNPTLSATDLTAVWSQTSCRCVIVFDLSFIVPFLTYPEKNKHVSAAVYLVCFLPCNRRMNGL
jgi:hypothetical protein